MESRQSRRRTIRQNLGILIAGALMGALAVTCSQPTHSAQSPEPAHSALHTVQQVFSPSPAFARAGTGAGEVTLADVAERAVPSVVNISATRVMKRRTPMNHPFFDDPAFRDFFGRGERGPGIPSERRAQALGSGVIVSSDGVVLTNSHVVEQADDVKVVLTDGRELDAEVVGTDPKSDIAVLRIKGNVSGLQALPLGSSSSLRLGEVVLAVGNPFGVGQTVTMGIVSATGRSSVGIVDYEDFIQTDAAINPGNSGGALINMRGELIGINTAILSRTGGNNGIGFAIPTDMVKPIMTSLLETGKVARGWLGVVIQDVDKNLAAGLGLPVDRGVLISDVAPDSPAAKAGLRRGDVIVSLDRTEMSRTSVLRNRIAALAPETKATLGIVREGKPMTVQVELGALSEQEAIARGGEVQPDEGLLSGAAVTNLSAAARRKYEIDESIKSGVVVTGVQPGSAAQELGLRPGDVIIEINRTPIESAQALSKLAGQAKERVVLLVNRGGNTLYLAHSK